jgi:hypothetical protein
METAEDAVAVLVEVAEGAVVVRAVMADVVGSVVVAAAEAEAAVGARG